MFYSTVGYTPMQWSDICVGVLVGGAVVESRSRLQNQYYWLMSASAWKKWQSHRDSITTAFETPPCLQLEMSLKTSVTPSKFPEWQLQTRGYSLENPANSEGFQRLQICLNNNAEASLSDSVAIESWAIGLLESMVITKCSTCPVRPLGLSMSHTYIFM